MLFHKERTTNSAGLGLATFDVAWLGTNCTGNETVSASVFWRGVGGLLTSAVMSWDEIEAVRRKTSRVILEEADGARGVIEPCESRNAAFCGEREREVVTRR